ncbi:MAG: DUF1284 domain-containing protein, partial [Coriobacteriia bacterium]|nr:DUF1284 domain-containing protein [Coriobacteriia bacterium]
MSGQPARLRGHHLVCLHSFAGEGYSEAFVANLREVLARAEDALVVVECADDVCAACPTLGARGECAREPGAEEGIRRLDALALELLGARPGDRMRFAETREGVWAALPRWLAEACEGCEWAAVCEQAREARQPSR